jgi:hypothetical protein
MAKALLGHVGAPNPRVVAELRRLRQRVCDLEAEIARLKEEHGNSRAAPTALDTDRITAGRASASELRPDADRAVASAVAGLRLAGRSWCAASSGRLLCGAQGNACRLRECRCSEALAEALARLEQSAG